MRVELVGKIMKVSFPYDTTTIARIKACHGVWNPYERVWEVALRNYPQFKSLFGKFDGIEEKYGEFLASEIKDLEEKWDKVLNHKIEPPPLINKHYLLPFQKQGVSFLTTFKRAILNFDIGLGKTVTAISACRYLAKENNKFLIVCPSSLKYNWYNEIKKFTPDKAIVVEGDAKKRASFYRLPYRFIITSYELVRTKDIEVIVKIPWKGLVLDETMRFKNLRTITNRNLRKINAEYRFGLTGSAIENRLTELYSIMRVIDKDVFGNWLNFKERFLVTQRRTFDGMHYFDEVVGYKNLDVLKRLFRKFLFRLERRKVLSDLPERQDFVYKIEMTPKQLQCYNEQLAYMEEMSNPLGGLSVLKQIVNFPEQVSMDAPSAKLDELKKILLETREKVIIFTFYVKSLKILERELSKEFPNRKVITISGECGDKEKDERIKEFRNSKEGTILLSTDCLSFGQNLQFCHIVINFDLRWNPIVMENRIGRIDRLGQKQNIVVIYLLTAGSIEERVWEVLSEKKELIQKLIGLTIGKPEQVDMKFLRWLLRGDNRVVK